MKARITFFIGLGVALLGLVQFLTSWDPVRLVTFGIGVFLMIWGGLVGWTRYSRLTLLLGHLTLTAGLFVTAWGLYQIPFQSGAPSPLEVLDLPLFWGLFSSAGGFCMITHGYSRCAVRCHERNNKLKGQDHC